MNTNLTITEEQKASVKALYESSKALYESVFNIVATQSTPTLFQAPAPEVDRYKNMNLNTRKIIDLLRNNYGTREVKIKEEHFIKFRFDNRLNGVNTFLNLLSDRGLATVTWKGEPRTQHGRIESFHFNDVK